MPRLASQMKSLTYEELTHIRLQLILKMLEIDPKLKRIIKLHLIKDEKPQRQITSPQLF